MEKKHHFHESDNKIVDNSFVIAFVRGENHDIGFYAYKIPFVVVETLHDFGTWRNRCANKIYSFYFLLRHRLAGENSKDFIQSSNENSIRFRK